VISPGRSVHAASSSARAITRAAASAAAVMPARARR
jgi:hypothetical protein